MENTIHRLEKYLIISTLISFFLIPTFAQNTILLKGIVLCKKTNAPVEFANISIKNKTRGTTSNINGVFKINLEKGELPVLIVSHINFYKEKIIINKNMIKTGLTVYLSPKITNLSEIIVSANLYEQPKAKLTKSSNLISHRRIIDRMNSNITDALASTPGFTQVWEYHSPIILRGLNSNRLLIMQDGNRRIGTFPGGYFGQDINIYDTKKIEIIKGPGSVIYGSGAISGIINLIRNEPFGKKSSAVKVISGYGSNNNEFLEIVKLCFKNQKFGVSVNGKFRKTDDFVYGNGETASNSKVKDKDFSLNTGYKFSDHHKIILNTAYHYGNWGKPRGFNGPAKKFTKIRNEEENFHTSLNYTCSLKGALEIIKLTLFYDKGKRDYFQYKYSVVSGNLSSLNLVHYKNQYGGGRLFAVLNITCNNKLTAGADGYVFRLDNPTDVIDYYNNTKGKIEGYKDAGQQNIGVFISDIWKINTKLRFISGVRFDAAKVIEGNTPGKTNRNETRSAYSGNLGFVYSLSKDMNLSFNVGRAFRMPTAEEMFTTIISCKGIKVGNPNLYPEYSWNFDLGLRGSASENQMKYDVSLFYNEIDNFINESPDTQNPDIDFTYTNSDARIFGGELSTQYRFEHIFAKSNSLYLHIGAAYVYGNDLSKEKNTPLFGIPPFKTRIELNYRGILNKKWITGYNIKLETEISAEQNRVASVPTGTDGGPWGYIPSDSHCIFNLAIGLNSNSLPGYPKLRIIVKNIFDKNYQPFGSYIPAMGRNIKSVLSFNF